MAILVIIVSLLASISASEAAGRYAAMVVDVNTGRILHAEAADEQRYPASLTKMMTLYLIFERLEEGRLSPRTAIAISERAAETSPSKLGLKAGSSISIENAIKALVTKSANDVAVAIAEHIAGSEEAFSRLMTAKAIELGMSHTVFRNPHGLPDSEQTTTARDMVLLGMRLYDHFPKRVGIFSLRSFSYAGKTHKNHNTMLNRFPGMEGLKTGYTRQSGYNLVASVRRSDGRHVIAAVFGGQSGAARNARMSILLNRALPRASKTRTRSPDVAHFRRRPKLVAQAKRPFRSAIEPPRLLEPVRRLGDWRQSVRIAAPIGDKSAVTAATLAAPQGATGDAPAPAPGVITVSRVRSIQVAPWGPPSEPSKPEARAPSTLQAQATRLASRQSALPSHHSPAATAAASRSPGAVEIQIGAYSAEAEARQQLETVRQRTNGLLADARMATPVVTVKGKRYYRARFTGFDAATAARTCNALRRYQFDCLVARSE